MQQQPRDHGGRFGTKPRSDSGLTLHAPTPTGDDMADDEYAIDATRFAQLLIEQRATRMNGGIYYNTQIDMAYDSNKIEGSALSKDQTRHLYETKTSVGEAPVNDVIEAVNHFRAFDAMIDDVNKPLTADTIKRYHSILKAGTDDSYKDWFVVGDWKRLANEVGGIETTPPAQVAAAIENLLGSVPDRMTFEDLCAFHVKFERIHPFQDGNGRVGRLILFQQCLANQIMPFVVPDAKKQFYYRGLAEYDVEPGYLHGTFRSAQDDYSTRYRSFVTPMR